MARIMQDVRDEAMDDIDADMPFSAPPPVVVVVVVIVAPVAETAVMKDEEEGESPSGPAPRGEEEEAGEEALEVLVAFAERMSSTKDWSWRLSSRMWGSRLRA